MRLMIAIPAFDHMQTAFVACLLKLINKLHADGVDFQVEIKAGTLVHTARDALAGKAMQDGFTHVLWLDSDMIFEPELVEDLTFSGQSFVTGICHSRRPPYSTCVFTDIQNDIKRWEGPYPTDTFKIAGCGMACVLMETQILTDVFNSYLTCFTPMRNYGEDLAFCLRAAGLGYKIYAEPSVRVGHIGQTIIYPEDHEKYLKELENGNH